MSLRSLCMASVALLALAFDPPARADPPLTVVVASPYGLPVEFTVPFEAGFQPDCTGDGRLNVQDFSCFLRKFFDRDTYANADGSGGRPVFNVVDFAFFLRSYARGKVDPLEVVRGTAVPAGHYLWNECMAPPPDRCREWPNWNLNWIGLPAPSGAGGVPEDGFYHLVVVPDVNLEVEVRLFWPAISVVQVPRPTTCDFPIPGRCGFEPGPLPVPPTTPWWDVQTWWPNGLP